MSDRISRIRARLDDGQPPTVADVVALLAEVDQLTAERDHARADAELLRRAMAEPMLLWCTRCHMTVDTARDDRTGALRCGGCNRKLASVDAGLVAALDEARDLAAARLTDRERIAAKRNRIRDHGEPATEDYEAEYEAAIAAGVAGHDPAQCEHGEPRDVVCDWCNERDAAEAVAHG